MKITNLIMLMVLLMLLPCAGCTTPIIGKIVDAETGQPIEGAILLVEWTKVHGFGNTYTSSEKVAEVISDKAGIVKIPGYNDPTAQGPDVTIYKPGYVAWNSNYIFPDSRNRTDFRWKNDYVFKLERLKPEYSHHDHTMFIYSFLNHNTKPYAPLFVNAIKEEENQAHQETKKIIKKLK